MKSQYVGICLFLFVSFFSLPGQAQEVETTPSEESEDTEGYNMFSEYLEGMYDEWVIWKVDEDMLSPEEKTAHMANIAGYTLIADWEYTQAMEKAPEEVQEEFKKKSRKYVEQINILLEKDFSSLKDTWAFFENKLPEEKKIQLVEIREMYIGVRTGSRSIEERLDGLENFYTDLYGKVTSFDELKTLNFPLYLNIWEFEIGNLKKEMQHFTLKQQTRLASLLSKIAQKKEELEDNE